MIAVGYHEDPSKSQLPPEILRREINPRMRASLENIVFKGRLHME
jgi:hypothetical protein